MRGKGSVLGVRRMAKRIERHATLRRHRFPRLTKFDIINRLGTVNGYTTYLELSTPTTGNTSSRISSEVFSVRRRVVYRATSAVAELPGDIVSAALDSRAGVAVSTDPGDRFDVVFVDPYHDRSTTLIDLEQGLELLSRNGVLVVHDCEPIRKKMAGAQFVPGEWVGQTYLGFLDFVAAHDELDFCVVDTHWGVGIVWRRADDGPARFAPVPGALEIAAIEYDRWEAYRRHRGRLLRLITPRGFERVFVRGGV